MSLVFSQIKSHAALIEKQKDKGFFARDNSNVANRLLVHPSFLASVIALILLRRMTSQSWPTFIS